MIKTTKPRTEMIEGPEAKTRFDALIGSVLSVPKSVIMKREAEYKKQSDANPNKRGPKPKAAKSRTRKSSI
jgi:hypothetical protein